MIASTDSATLTPEETEQLINYVRDPKMSVNLFGKKYLLLVLCIMILPLT